jgi:hypothetical protein
VTPSRSQIHFHALQCPGTKRIIWIAVGGLSLAVLIALGVPAYLASKRAGSENPIPANLRQIASAEESYHSQYRSYWTADVAGLYYHTPAPGQESLKSIELSIALADSAPARNYAEFEHRPKSGYVFRALKVEEPDQFAFAALPIDSSRTSFMVHKTGFWKKRLVGRPIDSFPKDPAADGWSRMD